ncbi:MAG: hypothetical protein WCB63_14180 [Polyangiales bacterium]
MTVRMVALALVLLMFGAAAFASGDFMLDDQFERTHARTDLFKDDPVVIVAGAQRKTPDAMQAWDRALRARAPEGTRVFGLSNLKKLPFFVPKSGVRKNLAEMLPKTPVLLDWKGKVYPTLGFPADALIAVGVFSAKGERIGLVNGEPNESRLAKVMTLLSR